MTSHSTRNLAPFYKFFETYGSERLNGLNDSHFQGLSDAERDEFEDVRAQFATSVPIYQVTQQAVDALKGMIFTETEQIPLASAITQYMVIHGMDFDMEDRLYNSIYMGLRSDDRKTKMAAMKRLEERQAPDYV